MESLATDGVLGSVTVKLPRHSVESFIAFMWWLVTDADRARSFATTLRAAGAVMTMLELTDWTKTSRVKAQMKDIEKRCGVEAEPCTQTTRRMIGIMIHETISKTCSLGSDSKLNEILQDRTEALLVLELAGGLRVGEATSSGDLHGLDANDVAFLTPISGGTSSDGLGTTVEVKILDSKTGLGRHAAFMYVTEGTLQLRAGFIIDKWCRQAGLKMVGSKDGGFSVLSPSYWVARVMLSSMSKERLQRFVKAVLDTKCEVIAEQAKAIVSYAKKRFESKTLDDQVRYVNVAGGHEVSAGIFDVKLMLARDWLEGQGFGAETFIVPGPLIRATLGKKLTHMPLATGSTYTHLIKAMKSAYEISKEMNVPDPEIDLQGLEPRFGNHSLRRHSDKVAREALSRELHGSMSEVTKRVIDYFYGWLLKDMTKDMQLHYAGLDRPSRRVLARVTRFL